LIKATAEEYVDEIIANKLPPFSIEKDSEFVGRSIWADSSDRVAFLQIPLAVLVASNNFIP